MTPEQLNESLARSRSWGSRDATLISAIGQVLVDEIEKACRPLRERIERLEKQAEQHRYVGVWATGKYHQGNMCTFDGSIFHCNVAETTQRPGTGPDWTLAIKRGQNGRDGKDGADMRRQPTAPRA